MIQKGNNEETKAEVGRTINEDFVMARILELCKERGWTKYRLAQETGISCSTINNLIKRTNTPTISTLIRICDGFGITMSQFFSDGKEVNLTREQQTLLRCWSLMKIEEKCRTAAFMKGVLGERGDCIHIVGNKIFYEDENK